MKVGAVKYECVIPLEIALRIADIGITSTPSGKTFSGLASTTGAAAASLTCAGALIASMSSLVILPPKPVPGTGAKGRVHADDVENFKGAQPKATPLARKIARMSSLVILPPKPVPDTLAKSIPRSAAILRASGVTLG